MKYSKEQYDADAVTIIDMLLQLGETVSRILCPSDDSDWDDSPEYKKLTAGTPDVKCLKSMVHLEPRNAFNAETLKKKFDRNYREDQEDGASAWEYLLRKSMSRSIKGLSTLMTKLLSQQDDISANPEAPSSAPMGRVAFPSYRKHVPFEVDTKLETDMYNKLEEYFTENIPLSSEDAAVLKKWLSKGWYADVFHEPEVKEVYRGLSVPLKWLMTAVKSKNPSAKGSLESRFTFTPRKGSSSWTTDRKIATDFSEGGPKGTYAVVLTAQIVNNPKHFLAGPGGLYSVYGFDEFDSEKEVVGLGPIKVSSIMWTNKY